MGKYCFGVDVGGTTVKIGLFTVEGDILEKWQIPTRTEDGGKNILPDISQSVFDKMAEKGIGKDEVIGVGLCVPGPCDDEGTVYKCVNLGWGVFNVKNALSELMGMPVEVGNDANVAALGEMWKGSGSKNMVMVTLGTGIGGGIIINGKMINGATGAGGEIGHIHIDDDEVEECGCGNKGCLEQYGSATGIARLANRRLAEDDAASVLRGKDNLDAKMVWDAVKEGDAVAIEIADRFGKILGKGLAMIAAVVNPEVFVIGGGVAQAGPILFDYISKYFKQYAFHGCRDTKFAVAGLKNDAGICGSAKLIIDGVANS